MSDYQKFEHSIYCINQVANFYPEGRLLITSKKLINLEPKINTIIHVLLDRVNMVVDKDSLVQLVWRGKGTSQASITRAMSISRKTLTELDLPEGKEIGLKNIYGLGYSLNANVQKKTIKSGQEVYELPESGSALRSPL